MATHAPSAPALRTTVRPKHSPALVRGPHRRIGRARPAAPSPVTALRAIVTETMDYPPARRPGRARLALSLSLYRTIRRLAGPVAAYRLSFAWSA